jgi:hypothetical protein
MDPGCSVTSITRVSSGRPCPPPNRGWGDYTPQWGWDGPPEHTRAPTPVEELPEIPSRAATPEVESPEAPSSPVNWADWNAPRGNLSDGWGLDREEKAASPPLGMAQDGQEAPRRTGWGSSGGRAKGWGAGWGSSGYRAKGWGEWRAAQPADLPTQPTAPVSPPVGVGMWSDTRGQTREPNLHSPVGEGA